MSSGKRVSSRMKGGVNQRVVLTPESLCALQPVALTGSRAGGHREETAEVLFGSDMEG